MSNADALLAELGELAGNMGSAMVPEGTEGLLAALTDTARRLFGASACSIALLSEDESELVYTTASGTGADDVTGMRIPATQGIAGFVVASGQPVAVNDLRNDVRFARDVAEQTGYVPSAILAVPVQSSHRMIGVLTLLDRDAERPGSEQDLIHLGIFADQAAIALEGARAFADLGRVLLAALGVAVDSGSDLGTAIGVAAEALPKPDRQLAELGELFSALAQQGPAERDLALRIVREVALFGRGRSRRQGR